MKRIINFFKKSPLAKKVFYWLAQTRPFCGYYQKWYVRKVQARLKNFKLSDLYLSIEPYNICNARCVMCPYQNMTRPKVKMTMELYQKIIDDVVANGLKAVNLNFYNEPFLDEEIFERIAYAKSRHLKVAMFSNGSLLTAGIIDKILASGLDVIDFSFDAFTKETYEKIRLNLNFEITRDNILNLIKTRNERGLAKPMINLVFVKSKNNLKEANDFEKFWSGLADGAGFSHDDNRNNTVDVCGHVAYPCRRLWSEMLVMSDGRVPLCCVDCDGEVILGDLTCKR